MFNKNNFDFNTLYKKQRYNEKVLEKTLDLMKKIINRKKDDRSRNK